MEGREEMQMENNAQEDTIDLMEVFKALCRKWYWLAACAIVLGLLMGIYGKFMVNDAFKAEASMCITSKDKEISMSDIQLGTALTGDYEGIIKSRGVLTKVIDNLDLDMSYKALNNAVSVENPDSTRILKIYVTTQDAETAAEIANEIMAVSMVEIPEVLGSAKLSVLDMADAQYSENTRRSVTTYLLLGIMFGIVAAGGIIVLEVVMDSSIKNEEDVKKAAGLSVIGAIPEFGNGKKKKSTVWPMDVPFDVSEAIYQLRTSVLYSGKDIKTIAVTSPDEGQGKSFISFHLAYSLSQVGKKVLLVDTDMRNSVLQKRMGLDGIKLGLSEYLSGNAEAGQVIYDVGIPNMHVLFSGKLVMNASALLSAKWLRILCGEVKDSYDYIIFDTPPINIVGDAAVISSVCDGIMVVVQNGVTKKATLSKVKTELEKVNANVIGVVQNMVGSKKDAGNKTSKKQYGNYYYSSSNKR